MMRRAKPLLGTIVEIAIDDALENAGQYIEAAFEEIVKVERLMSFHKADSDVSRINAAPPGCFVEIDALSREVLAFAHNVSEASQGGFDIVIAVSLQREGFLPETAAPTDRYATYKDLDLTQEGIVWRRKGCIDLGGIAKGFAVDRAIHSLRKTGIVSGVVNAGGDLRCFGGAHKIHLRNPDNPGSVFFLGELNEGSIATSASYFSSIEGEGGRQDPLVDPETGLCNSWGGSYSVIARDCMTADALTKAIRLRPALVQDLTIRFDAQAIVQTTDGWRTIGRSWLGGDIAV